MANSLELEALGHCPLREMGRLVGCVCGGVFGIEIAAVDLFWCSGEWNSHVRELWGFRCIDYSGRVQFGI